MCLSCIAAFEKTYAQSIEDRSDQVQGTHHEHPLKRKSPSLHRKVVDAEAMGDEDDPEQAETGVHHGSVGSEGWASEWRIECARDTAPCTDGYLYQVIKM